MSEASNFRGILIDGRYEIRDQLARGGMATVYSALDTRLDRMVAVKIMHPHLAQDEDFVSRFIREAKSAASITHPNIIAIHDQGWHQGGPPAVFMVMEYVDGPTLRDLIRERGRLTITESLGILESVLAGLTAAHRVGIVHRDIKPENVILAEDGRIKVADFGLARALSGATTLTQDAGLVIGTIAYLSPELVERGIADARSDVYSCGILLYEMITGRKPFDGETPIQVAYQHVNHDVPAPSKIIPSIPVAVDAIVRRATSRDPDLRPRDAMQFMREIQTITTQLDDAQPSENFSQAESEVIPGNTMDSSPSIKKSKTKPRYRRRRVLVLIALAFALGIGTWYTVLGPGADVATPSLVGQTLEEAKNEIDLSGLTLAQSSSQFSEDIPAGRIIKSSPSGGVQVAKGSEVKIIVSKGPERFTVPTLTGLSLTEATSLLIDNNLKISTLATQYDEKVPLGYIVSSSPSYGTKLKRNSVVGVIVSKGIEEVAIESFVGKLSDQALSQLKESGFTVVIQSDYSNSISAGRVISQVPSTGKLAKGSKVALVVSKGPNLITVPNVVKNLTGAQAGKILEDLGLTFKPNILKRNGPGKVIGQSIKAGTKVKPGTLVLLDIY